MLTYLPPTPEEATALAGGHVVVAGSGHSAMTAVVELANLAKTNPKTQLTWVLRRGAVGNTFGGGATDELPRRGALGQQARRVVQQGIVDLVTGFRVERVEPSEQNSDQVVLVAEDGRRLAAADRVLVLTGFRAGPLVSVGDLA